jgi:ribosomal protein S18 acetylase RimI-like enzyme
MDIRPATAEDAALLAALNSHVHDQHVAAEPQVYRPTHANEVAAWFLTRLSNGDVALIAQEGTESIGYVMARLVERPGHLFAYPRRFLLVDQLAVAQAARRRGVGRALMTAIESHALASSLDTVELDVRAANPAAVAFFSALGYRTEQLHFGRKLSG